MVAVCSMAACVDDGFDARSPAPYPSRPRPSAGARIPSSVLVPSVPLSPELRVTRAELEHMPFYLRTFFEYRPVGCTTQNPRSNGPSRAR